MSANIRIAADSKSMRNRGISEYLWSQDDHSSRLATPVIEFQPHDAGSRNHIARLPASWSLRGYDLRQQRAKLAAGERDGNPPATASAGYCRAKSYTRGLWCF